MATFDPGSSWINTWEDFKASVDAGGTTERTALLLPTSASGENCRVTPGTLFNWHHLAPPIRFEVTTRDPDGGVGRTITITSYVGEEELKYTHEKYLHMGPDISFYYENPSNQNDYIFIGTFKRNNENEHLTVFNGQQHSIDITRNDVETVKICVSCDGCSLSKDFLGYLKLYTHSHISAPAAPTISSTTGKTITVSNGQDGLYCTTNNDGWYNESSHTFTGLSQGTNYNFKCKKICPDCPGNQVFESTTVTGKTWSISGSYVNSGAKSITYKATHVAGTGGNADNKTITYKLYTSKNASGTPIATTTGNNGIPVTFTNIDPGKTYYCYAYTTNLGNGDNNCWISGTTKTAASVSGSGGDVSATTLRSSVSWNAGGATSVTCTVSCNGSTKSLSTSGGYVGFTGLTPGINYTVSYKVVSTYTYTYEYKVKENGKEVTKKETKTDTIETTGSSSYTTKKSQFGVPINVTSKIIQFKSLSNYSGDTMEQKISTTNWESIAQNTYIIYNNLTHNTSYTIYCRINGCYAYDGNGNKTSVNDSEISQTVKTYLLSLAGSISEEHQHSLVTLWQAYVNNEARNSDAIDGTAFEFTYMDTLARKNNPPYQASEVIEGSNGNTTGNYQSGKKVYSNNLTWYYCEYIVTVSITDGYNIVANTVTAHTIFPATWMFTGGQWHRYMPHVYTNGKWVPAPAFIYSNNKFIEPNGE